MVNDFVKVNSLLPIYNAIIIYYHLPKMSGNVCNIPVTVILNHCAIKAMPYQNETKNEFLLLLLKSHVFKAVFPSSQILISLKLTFLDILWCLEYNFCFSECIF